MPISRKRRKPKRNIMLTLLSIFIITLILSVVISAAIVFFIVKDALTDLPEMDPTIYTLKTPRFLTVRQSSESSTTAIRTEIHDEISKMPSTLSLPLRTRHFGAIRLQLCAPLGAVRDAIPSDSDISGTSAITQLAKCLSTRTMSEEVSTENQRSLLCHAD